MPAKHSGRTMHVISNTHWDREWMKTFQEHRIMLADYLDRLMDLFDADRGFKYFHLDSQTIPLEDYASVRPGSVNRLRKYIRQGKLLIGPWYTLPEMNVLDGESIIRNLVMGHSVAQKWGPVMKVGYTPTSNGQISQLPQIYAGFGIDSILFYRGINADAAKKEFHWKSPDGTTALCEQFPDGRVVFWGIGMLPVVYNMWPFKGETWQFRWNKRGLPFRMDDEREFTLVRPPDLYDAGRIAEALSETRAWETKYATVDDLLYLDGMDQSPPNRWITRLIRDANRICKGDHYLHDSLPRVMAILKKKARNLQTLTGEMRLTNKSGRPGFCYLHPGILATRMYLKQANRQSEYKLFKWAEPMAAAAWMLGEAYPASFIECAIKTLLQNHAHDDICGCSVDKVHADMMYRFSEVNTLTDDLTRRSLRSIVKNINTSRLDSDGIFMLAANSLPFDRADDVRMTIDLPAESPWKKVALQDGKGNLRPFHVIDEKETSIPVPHDGHTRQFPVRRITGYCLADAPAMGYEVLRVVEGAASDKRKNLAASVSLLENDLLRVRIKPNGSLDITHKATGRVYRDQHYFADNGECGNAWIIKRPERDTVVTTLASRAKVRILINTPDIARIRISVTMQAPARLSPDGKSRSKVLQPLEITSTITMAAGSPVLDIQTSFDNRIESHRLRAMFPSDITTAHSYAETPCDVVKRAIALPRDAKKWVDPPSPNFPQLNYMFVTDGRHGLAVINDGLPDYEVIDDRRRTIALTLVRGLFQGDLLAKENWGERGAQCLGRIESRYAIYPFAGAWEKACIAEQALMHNVPMRTAQFGQRDGGSLPLRHSFLSVAPSCLTLLALKRSEKGDGLIVRLSNPTDNAINGALTLFKPIKSAKLTNMNEEPITALSIKGNTVKFPAGGKKIVTMEIKI
jgi:alpha-mannosidase